MVEKVNHTSLQVNSGNFTLNGGTVYSVNCAGTIAFGSNVELHRIVNGSPVSLNPPAIFQAGQSGATYSALALPAGTYRWSLQTGAGHNVNTAVVGAV